MSITQAGTMDWFKGKIMKILEELPTDRELTGNWAFISVERDGDHVVKMKGRLDGEGPSPVNVYFPSYVEVIRQEVNSWTEPADWINSVGTPLSRGELLKFKREVKVADQFVFEFSHIKLTGRRHQLVIVSASNGSESSDEATQNGGNDGPDNTPVDGVPGGMVNGLVNGLIDGH